MKRVRFKMFVCVLVIWSLTTVTFAKPGKGYGHVKKELLEYFQQEEAARTFNGSVLIAEEGKILMQKGFGKANFETGKANTPDTVFAIASMGKAFATVCIMMLEERGLLSVYDTIENYIPEFPNGDIITIHQLMTHTAGLYLYIRDPNSPLWDKIDQYHTPEQLMEYFMYEPFRFEPGTDWEYCNSGYVLIGIIIERVSGMSYSEFLKTNIFEPLNMNHTFYDPYDEKFLNKRATGYIADISTNPPTPSGYLHASAAYAAGGIFSTLKDMYKWEQALSTDKLVSFASLDRIFTPYAADYGYGWWIDTFDIHGQHHNQIWHWGAYIGYHSLISRLVDDDVIVILLMNTDAPDPMYPDNVHRLLTGVTSIIYDPPNE